MKCWCGAVGTYKELFDDSGLEEVCGGLGILNCFCGGDQCVCHHHGEAPCGGCEYCNWGNPGDEFDGFFIDLVRDHEADDRRS